MQCIGEAFGVDPSNSVQVDRLNIKPATLLSLFDLYLKTKDKLGAAGAGSSGAAPGPSTSTPTPPTSKGPSEKDKKEAETRKQKGNSLMSSKQWDAAIAAYTEAVALDGTNAVYFSNRAAAYSSKGDHTNAIADAEKAIEINPSFSKAYHRLG